MAIAFDAGTNGGVLAASPMSFSHTCTGSNLFLWVIARHTSASDTVTGITYNSVAMSKATFEPPDAGVNYYALSMWYLKSPTAGANTVTITTSSGTVSGYAVSYTGVLGTFDATNQGSSAATTTVTGNITTVADNCWAVMAFSEGDGQATASTNFTTRVDDTSQLIGDSNASITPAGSFSMSATFASATVGWVIGSMSPTASTATTSRDARALNLLGVG